MTGALAIAPSHAAQLNTKSNAYKRDAAAASAVIAGALVAGPVGAVVGAVGGKWIAGQVARAGELAATQETLAAREQQILALEASLVDARSESERYAQMALDHLQLEMLFHTGDSELTAGGVERLALLADFLRSNEAIAVRVDGFADPRGKRDDNLRLSTARAESVAAQLLARGIPAERITAQGHGASASDAAQGDLDAYALERVVRIELHRDDRSEAVAQVEVAR
ncbi:MAG: OmpA family protein [Chromatocurvus sp.]